MEQAKSSMNLQVTTSQESMRWISDASVFQVLFRVPNLPSMERLTTRQRSSLRYWKRITTLASSKKMLQCL